jgi:hypothetical protein
VHLFENGEKEVLYMHLRATAIALRGHGYPKRYLPKT